MAGTRGSLLWKVEVQLPTWRNTLRSAKRLRRALETDPVVVQVCEVTPFLQRLLLRSIPPTVTIMLVADSPDAAYRSAADIVTRSLAAIGKPGPAIPLIIGTEGEPAGSHPPGDVRHG
jgi:hypothetical protein